MVFAICALVVASFYHVVLIFSPPSWTAFAGAPPFVVQSLVDGTWLAPTMIVVIASLLLVMAAYGASYLGWVGRLPLLRLGLGVIASLFLIRGLAIVPQFMTSNLTEVFDVFHLLASAIVIMIGLAYLWSAIKYTRTA